MQKMFLADFQKKMEKERQQNAKWLKPTNIFFAYLPPPPAARGKIDEFGPLIFSPHPLHCLFFV